jgi:hypothetical protein
MNSLTQITTNLDLSKRLDIALKKAGIKVEPLFVWADVEGNGDFTEIQYENDESCERYDFIPALTANELKHILKKEYNSDGCISYYDKNKNMYYGAGLKGLTESEKEEDALAKTLIYLLDYINF